MLEFSLKRSSKLGGTIVPRKLENLNNHDALINLLCKIFIARSNSFEQKNSLYNDFQNQLIRVTDNIVHRICRNDSLFSCKNIEI